MCVHAYTQIALLVLKDRILPILYLDFPAFVAVQSIRCDLLCCCLLIPKPPCVSSGGKDSFITGESNYGLDMIHLIFVFYCFMGHDSYVIKFKVCALYFSLGGIMVFTIILRRQILASLRSYWNWQYGYKKRWKITWKIERIIRSTLFKNPH